MITNPQKSESPRLPLTINFQRGIFSRPKLLGFGTGALVAIAGGVMYGNYWVEREVSPLVEVGIEHFLNRPVQLGKLTGVSLTHLEFGATSIPATAKDPNWVKLKGLKVSYNPWQYLQNQHLALTITAIQPQAYLEQGRSGSWWHTETGQLEEDFPFQLKKLIVTNGQGTVALRNASQQLNDPVQIRLKNAHLSPDSGQEIFQFSVDGQLLPAENPHSRLEIEGKFNLPQESLNLQVRSRHLPLASLKEILPLPLDFPTGSFDSQLAIAVENQELVSLDGEVNLHQGSLKIPQLTRPLTNINGPLIFQGRQIKLSKIQGQLGEIKAKSQGYIDWRDGFNMAIATAPLEVNKIFQGLRFPPSTVPITGQLASNVKIKGALENPQITVDLQQAGKDALYIENLALRDLQAQINLEGDRVVVNKFQAFPPTGGTLRGSGQINAQRKGSKLEWQPFQMHIQAQNVDVQPWIDPDFQAQFTSALPLSGQAHITGELAHPETWQAQAKANLPMAGGLIQTDDFSYQGGQWQGNFQLQNLALQPLTASVSPPLPGNLQQGKLQGRVRVEGNQKNPQQWQLEGKGQVNLPQGAVTIAQFQLQGKQWQGTFSADNIPLQTLPALDKRWSGTLAGNWTGQGQIDQPVHLWNLEGAGQWQSPKGTVKIREINLENQNFTAQLSSEGIDWRELQIPQPGQVQGQLALAGQWTTEKSQLKELKGNLTSTKGWQSLESAVDVAFDWQNSTLNLSQLRSKGLNAQGSLQVSVADVKPGFDFLAAVGGMALQVQAENFPVNDLIPRPIAVPVLGNLDFSGQVTGSALHPLWQGQLEVHRLQLGDFRFAPQLTGEIEQNTEGLLLALQGEKDEKIRLNLDQTQQPQAMLFERGELQLAGKKQGDQLSLTARSLPLDALQAGFPLALAIIPNADPSFSNSLEKLQSQPWGGKLSGHFQLDLDQKTAIATRVNIQQPRWGSFRAQDLTGNFRYGQGQLMVENSRLRYGQSTVLVRGQGNFQGKQPQWAGEISFRQSRIEDILAGLQLFTWQDFQRGLEPPHYGNAQDLYTNAEDGLDNDPSAPLVSVGNALDNLTTQFNQLALSQAVLPEAGENGENKAVSLPTLEQLRGQLQGKITVRNDGQSPLAASFNLQGNQWQWGDYQLEQLQLAGRWQGDEITLEPLELRSGEQFLRVTGALGPNNQRGEIQLHQLPLTPLAKLLNIPSHLAPEGDLFADLRLQGDRQDPQFQGKIQIKNNRIGPLALEQTQGNFSYQTGRFDFQLQSLVNSLSEPLQLEGSFPYVFPFASQLPTSDQFSLALKLKNDSLGLLNLVSNEQLSWLSGQGKVDLTLFGRLDPQTQTLYQLQGLGEITIKDGAIAAKALPNNPLTQVNGQILADLNTLQVTGLTGQISGGSLAMAGTLPLKNPLPNADQSLQLSLNNLAVDVPNFYQGALQGLVNITGTAIAPRIGGQLALANGNILVGNVLPKLAGDSSSTNGGEFKDLTISLGENIRVQNLPFLDFAASGGLRLNGSPQQIRPEGQINLNAGQVNLFASQLRLDSSQENTVYFLPQRGLDPYLDLYLLSSASETSRNITNRSPLSSEVVEPFSANQDSLQTVRIQAHINGYGSEINDSIQLTSNPGRSEQEIITLLGGGVLSTLGQDNTQTTVGLANLAGSAVLGGIQGRIGEALGLREFRIFSTPLTNEEDKLQGNQIGVAAEAGIDLTPQLGVSVQKIINSDRLPQWGLEYRLNDSTVIRGSSNFQDDSRGMVEFQKRF